MRPKKRYFLVKVTNINNIEDFSKIIYNTLNKYDKFINIKANFRIVKDIYKINNNDIIGVIRIDNKYKYEVVCYLSLMIRESRSSFITLKNSGSIKKIKMEVKNYGSDAK